MGGTHGEGLRQIFFESKAMGVERRRFAKCGWYYKGGHETATCAYSDRVVHMRLQNELCVLRSRRCRPGRERQWCIECEVKKALEWRGFGMEGISEVTIIKVMCQMGYPGYHDYTAS
jgi:hypothetical protein